MITQRFRLFSWSSLFTLLLILSGCGEGDSKYVPLPEDTEGNESLDIFLNSGAVKGPVAFSDISIYSVDLESERYANFKSVANGVFKAYADLGISIDGDSLVLPEGRSSAQVLNDFEALVETGSYVSELDYFKVKVENAGTIAKAKSYLDVYLGLTKPVKDEDSTFDLLKEETNSIVKDRVSEALSAYSDLNDFKRKLNDVDGFYEELLEVGSFSGVNSVVAKYSTKESDPTKAEHWSALKDSFSELQSLAMTSKEIAERYDVVAFDESNDEKTLVEIALETNDQVAISNLKELRDSLAQSLPVIDLKELVYLAYRKEGNPSVKAGLNSFFHSIITYQDLISIVQNHRAVYSFLGVREGVDAAEDIQAMHSELMSLMQQEAQLAFDSILLSTDVENGVSANRLSYGSSNGAAKLEGLFVGQYRGFIYIEANMVPSSVDLNSGKAPILSKMVSIIHTDDILGYGDNEALDETRYYVKNGIVQRNAEGELITSLADFESGASDELFTVQPSRYTTPLTSLAVEIAQQKVINLQPLVERLNDGNGYQGSAANEKNVYFDLGEQALSELLEESQSIVSRSFNITEGDELKNIFAISPVTLPHMKYFQDELEASYRYRFNIEYYGAMLQSLKVASNLDYEVVQNEIAKDLYDGQIDGKQNSEFIESLSSINSLTYFATREPSSAFIPDTTVNVSELGQLLEQEFELLVGEDSDFGEYNSYLQNLALVGAAGGVDSDGDGMLDNDDPDPSTPNEIVDNGYDGLRSVSVQFEDALLMPIDQSLVLTIPIEEVQTGDDEKLSCAPHDSQCILVGDMSVEIEVASSINVAPDTHNATISSRLFDSGSARFLELKIDGSKAGSYSAYVQLTTEAQVNPETKAVEVDEQQFGFELPFTIFDFSTLEFRVVSENQDPVTGSEFVNAGSKIVLQFKATDQICELYPVCGDNNENVGEFLDLDLIGESFSVQYQINDEEEASPFQLAASEGLTGDLSVISNLQAGQAINATLTYSDKQSSIYLGDINASVVDVDAVDFREKCPEPLSGIDDVNGDGVIDANDNLPCFADILAATDSKAEVYNSDLDEYWYFDDSWHFIIRESGNRDRFLGHVQLPKDKYSNYQKVQKLLFDSELRRMYLAFSGGAISYYSLTTQSVSSFYIPSVEEDTSNFVLLGSNLLIQPETSNSAIFDSNGDVVSINFGLTFPEPGRLLTPHLGNLSLTRFANDIAVRYEIERYRDGSVQSLEGLNSTDTVSLDSGQGEFGDTLTIYLSVKALDEQLIEYSYSTHLIGTNGFVLNSDYSDDENPPLLSAGQLDLSGAHIADHLYVEWAVNDISTDSLVYSFTDKRYPYLYEASKLEYGDVIEATIYLKRSADFSSQQDIRLATLEGVFVGDLGNYIPVLDTEYWDENLHPVDASVKARLISSTENDDFYAAANFTPVWFINDVEVPGESSFEFPTNPETNIRFGDVISVEYSYSIGQESGRTETLRLPTIETDSELTEFSITPVVVEEGESVSLDLSKFSAVALETLEARWYINGELDRLVKDFTYPGEKLRYGDLIRLELAPLVAEDNEVQDSFSYEGAKAFVGLNIDKLNGSTDASNAFVDSDGDGVPNFRDYFRFDQNCSVEGEGRPDDLDSDGLPDLVELTSAYSTNPHLRDSDSDGINDFTESELNLSPVLLDSDGDGYSDGFELIWGSDPIDDADPSIGDDKDHDGLTDELELVNGTLVNGSDSDNDGLEDGLELLLGTEPLSADSDGDGLSDGVEKYLTSTNPLIPDSDGDQLSDGVEVALTLTDPSSSDTDNDGVLDREEESSLAIDDKTLYQVLYPDDLLAYNKNASESFVPQGTCYATWLARNKADEIKVSFEPQIDESSKQEVLFFNDTWPEVIRFQADQGRFTKAIGKGDIDARITSANYARTNSNLLYLGFSDGSIWSADLTQAEPSLTLSYLLPEKQAVIALVDQGDFLLASVSADGASENIFMFEDAGAGQSPVNVSPFSSNIQLSSAVWQNADSAALWGFRSNSSELVQLVVDVPGKSLSQTIFESDQTLVSPLYVKEEVAGSKLYISNGVTFDTNDLSFEYDNSSNFNLGIYHQDHHIQSMSANNALRLSYGLTGEWSLEQSYYGRELVALIPTGFNVLALTQPSNIDESGSAGLRFDVVQVGDSDDNGLPQWWESLFAEGTLAQFSNFDQPEEYDFSTDFNSIIARDFDSDSEDMDDDGLSNSLERSLGSCVDVSDECPTPSDSDLDGLSDLFEQQYSFTDSLGIEHRVSLTSGDTDADGLSDYDEIITIGSYPDNNDSDGDLICDAQELELTGTDLLNSDSDGDGLTDGRELGIVTLNCDALFKGDVFSDPLSFDSDEDGLNDREEFFASTDPFNPDSDGDGLKDGQEVIFGGDPLDSMSRNGVLLDGEIDSDSDGLSDSYELNHSNSNPNNADSDSDGLSDYVEVTLVGSNPNNIDTDGDLICDIFEDIYDQDGEYLQTDPALSDTDSDELSDAFELGLSGDPVSCSELPNLNPVSDPRLSDSDGDGLSDVLEVTYVYDSYSDDFRLRKPDVNLTIDPLLLDTDGDLLCDFIELGVSNPAESDTDFDGLNDATELGLELSEVLCTPISIADQLTSPVLSDSDNDGLSDGQEILITGTDPLDTDSDDDGIRDGDEDRDGDGLSDYVELNLSFTLFDTVDSDGNEVNDALDDQDGDGLSNIEELGYGTCIAYQAVSCPSPEDSDQDGVSDFDEINRADQEGTDPLGSDTDGDELTDSEELAIGTNPLLADSDLDGIDDNEELTLSLTDPLNPDTDNDFLADGQDDSPLQPDSDNDSLLDGIEVHILGTSPDNNDSDVDGLKDGDEVWVYGFGLDELTLLKTGRDLDIDLNSKSGVTGWNPPSNSFEGAAYEYLVTDVARIVVNDAGTSLNEPFVAEGDELDAGVEVIGKIHIRYISNPSLADSDGDGLTDYTELMLIEKTYGDTRFDINPLDINTSYQELESNEENFKVSDPLRADTDGDGLSDGDEDIDDDLYVNDLDQNNEDSSVIVADTDFDGLPDGIEVLLTQSNPAKNDTDGDGLFDGNQNNDTESRYEVIYDSANPPRLIESTASCNADEYRLSNIGNSEYCVQLSYISDPSKIDSDADGVPDRYVTESSKEMFDHFPLDRSCHRLTDGVIDNDDPSDRKCYSAWMAGQASIDQVRNASWDDISAGSQNVVTFSGKGWDRIIRYRMGASEDTSYYLPHTPVSGDVVTALSGSLQRLYFADDEGAIYYQNLESDSPLVPFVQLAAEDSDVVHISGLGDNLFVFTRNSTALEERYKLIMFDAAGALLGSIVDIEYDVLPDSIKLACRNDSCTTLVDILAVVRVDNHPNNEVLSMTLDLSTFGIASDEISTIFESSEKPLSGPIQLSENGELIYFGSGHQLTLASLEVPVAGSLLHKSYGLAEYSTFYDLHEENQHFIAIVDDPSSLFNSQETRAVYIEDNKPTDDGEPTKYLIQQATEDELMMKVLPQQVAGQSDFALLSVYDSLVDIMPIGVTDQDSDGMPGIFEMLYGLDDSDPSDKFKDLDKDNLTNIEEYLLNTKPDNSDSNDNGVSDFQEAYLN